MQNHLVLYGFRTFGAQAHYIQNKIRENKMKRTGPTNINLQNLIVELKKHSQKEKSAIWNTVAEYLMVSTRSRRVVNLSNLNRSTKENEIVIVPGKLLGAGAIDHSVTVAAFNFSGSAIEKIKKSKGTCLTLQELMKKNPKGKDMRIIG